MHDFEGIDNINIEVVSEVRCTNEYTNIVGHKSETLVVSVDHQTLDRNTDNKQIWW